MHKSYISAIDLFYDGVKLKFRHMYYSKFDWLKGMMQVADGQSNFSHIIPNSLLLRPTKTYIVNLSTFLLK